MRLSEIMSTNVKTVSAAELAEAAVEKMRLFRVRHLVVVDDDGIVGVVSERDFGGPRASVEYKNRTVSDFMTSPAVSATPTMSVRSAANLLRGRPVGCLPVVDEGKLVGIVTATDILELIGRGAEKPTPSGTRRTLKKRDARRQNGHPLSGSH